MAGVRYDHSSADDLLWEGDDAHQACKSWLEGWRQTHGPDAPLPMGALHPVGTAASRLSGEGWPRIPLAKLMHAAGRDGITEPDADPGDTNSARAA